MVRITSFFVSIASAEHKESKGCGFPNDLKRNAETIDIPQILMVFKPFQGSKAIKFDGHCGVLSSPRGDGRSFIITLHLFKKYNNSLFFIVWIWKCRRWIPWGFPMKIITNVV